MSELLERGYRLPVEKGLVIYQVSPNGSAQRAGLRGISAGGNLGDILLSADGQKMDSIDDLYRLLDKKQFGDTIQVEIFRDGKTLTVPVKLLSTTSPPVRSGQRE
ncbi:MAG: PDZ domain-containing protein [Pyrinomonadaceae bacterium]|nr:PDZ domain-containing protein [Pyrinomonadaceae bacterium]